MSNFIQLHVLTSYPPANLNRDDLGRPKTAVMGGSQRLRISSQSLKRAWRTSDLFVEKLKGNLGTRTKRMGKKVYDELEKRGVSEKNATAWALKIASVFGKSKKEGLENEQLTHFSPEEERAIADLIIQLVESGVEPSDADLKLLRKEHTAVDIAMFGRMLASEPEFNMEAAVQVAHAITVHEVAVEDDYFTAVDDLNNGAGDTGAAHLGETEFAAGLFYLYICMDKDLLIENLKDIELANKAIQALTEAVATVAPRGKQNSFGSRAYASYILAEKGTKQPRSLSVSFLKSVNGKSMLTSAAEVLEETRSKMDKAYGPCDPEGEVLDVAKGEGSLQEILEYVAG